jgi:pimeloyl-ACP methyl ester carboxylesterase
LEKITTPAGITYSYTRAGTGEPLVLVHGALSDHASNWEHVIDDFRKHFTVYAVARRGRGETSKTTGHGIRDEAADVAALVDSIGEPVNLLGHSYGAITSVEAALLTKNLKHLVLYEPPNGSVLPKQAMERFACLAVQGDWDRLLTEFFCGILQVPEAEVGALKGTPYWDGMIGDAENSMEDFRAVFEYQLDAERFRSIGVPVTFLVGTESPREIYATDPIAGVLADAKIVELEGQAHEGMTFAPAQFVEKVLSVLAPTPRGA